MTVVIRATYVDAFCPVDYRKPRGVEFSNGIYSIYTIKQERIGGRCIHFIKPCLACYWDDNFDEGVLDLDKWENPTPTEDVTVNENGKLNLYSNWSQTSVTLKANFVGDFELQYKASYFCPGGGTAYLDFIFASATESIQLHLNSIWNCEVWSSLSDFSPTEYPIDLAEYEEVLISLKREDITITVTVDGNEFVSTDSQFSTLNTFTLVGSAYGYGCNSMFDDLEILSGCPALP